MPIDRERASALIRRQRTALARAVNSKDPAKVVLAARQAVSEWNQPGMYWPDDWSRWQRALDNALPGQTILLEDLTQTPAQPAVGLRTGNQDPPGTSAQPQDTAGQRADAEGTPGETDTGQRRRSTGTGRTAQETPRTGPGQHAPAHVDGDETAIPDTARATLKPAAKASAPPAGSQTATGTHPVPGQSADSSTTAPEISPLTNSDLAGELRRLPGFARWLSQAGALPAAADLEPQRAGSSAACDERGIEITISGPEFTRHGLVTWPQAASWIDNGVTPARLGLAVIADRLATFCRDHRDQLIAAGTCDPGATAAELGHIRDTAVAMIVDAALASRGAAAPVPPARPDDPAWYTAVMTTRPHRGAGKAENAALERLTQVRTLIREPQPATPAEIRATLRRRIGYGLAGMVRALDDPAAVRTWINGQASRPVPDGYDNSGERWYGTCPDGLITDRNGDDRAPGCIRWEDIPAWIQPGITSSVRDRLIAAADASSVVFRRAAGAAVRQDPGAAPGEDEDKQARQRLREATDAAWAAIEAAPPPSPADLDRARRDYIDWRPVQQTLFGDLPQDSTRTPDGTRTAASRPPRPARTGPATSAGNGRPAAKAAALQQEPAAGQDTPGPAAGPAADAGRAGQQADRPDQPASPEYDQSAAPSKTALARAGGTTAQNPGTAGPASAGPAHGDDPEPPPAPATNSDLAIALHSMSGQELAGFLTSGKTPDGHGSLTNRRKGLPDAGASQMLSFDRSGVRITLASRGFRRHGQITWRQVASWIDTGLTPARLGIIIAASGLHTFTYARRDELIAAGKDNIDAAITELSQISADAIDAALGAALSDRDAGAPVPPARSGKPAYRAMAMLTGLDPSATPEENTALARIAELGAAIRGTQPVTPADTRTAIRWWIGDSLPEYARALASPEAMRGWIRRQASGPASRPGRGTYENGRYYSASPEGLRTSRGSDTRAAPWILWEEIPAWIQPGLSASLREKLTAEPRPAPGRTRTAAARPPAGPADPASQADDPLPGPLREAVNAAWAAIQAAPPPSPADLDHARTSYRATATTQHALPGSPAKTGQPGQTAAPAPRPEAGPRPAQPPQPAPAAHRQDAPAPAADRTQHRERAAAPATLTQPDSTGTALTGDDIFLGLSRLPAFLIADLFTAIDSGWPLESVPGPLAPYTGTRAAGEPDTGAPETVTARSAGVSIQVTAEGSTRAGLLTWTETADWLQPGLTQGRRQVMVRAQRTSLRFAAASASFRAAAESSLALQAEQELRALAGQAVTAALLAARAGRPAQPAGDETAALERIAQLTAALPAQPPQPRTPASQVTAGNIIGHPAYRLHPFRVAAPPQHHEDRVELTGRLTEPADGEPAGQITLTLPRTRQPDPVVYLIPAPARSLRPLFPAPGPGADASQGQAPGISTIPGRNHGHDAPAGHPQAPPTRHRQPAKATTNGNQAAPGATAPGKITDTTQPPAAPAQEDTLPPQPAAAPAQPPGMPSPAAPAPATAPAAPPSPAPPGNRAAGQPGSTRAEPQARPGGEDPLLRELDRVLAAIIERRRAAAVQAAGDDFDDIRAAFTGLRNALAVTGSASPAQTGNLRPAAVSSQAAGPARDGSATTRSGHAAPGGFDDIRAAFADLRSALGLPPGSSATGTVPPPGSPYPDAGRMLDQAAAEAQACARWYGQAPEWQRITTIARATRELIRATREAAGDWWAEVRQDIRAQGFFRTLGGRVCRAVSEAAGRLAGQLERAGHGSTRTWRAVHALDRAAAAFAGQIMRYTPPGHPGQMNDVRRIIDGLSARPRGPAQPSPNGSRRQPAGAPDPVTLASTSFPAPVTRATIARPAPQPARRAEPAPARRHPVHRP